MVTFTKGICCGCHSPVPIVPSPIPRLEVDSDYPELEYGESINYICVDHDFYGATCDGSGQMPQAVCK